MEKHKLKDFIDATKEEAGNVAVEEVLPAVVKEAGGFIVSEGVGMLASEIVGAVVPVANNIRLSYKQNRLERNVIEALQIVQRNQDELENKIVKLQQSNLEYQRQITEALLDNIVEEPQEAMVKYNVNGYVNLLKSDNTNLDIVLMFFKTLSQLSDLDIRVLKSYSYLGNDGENILDICKDIHVDFEQMRFIREKLERFGLWQSKNEEINDNNLKEIVKYLQNLEKESKKSKPGGVKIPKLKHVFDDPECIEMYDFEHSTNEDRYIALGVVGDVLFVVYTERKEAIRLISARLATNTERRLYYDQDIYY